MKKMLLSLLVLSGCVIGDEAGVPGDDTGGSDDQQDPNPNPNPNPNPGVCALPATTADTGSLTAAKAQQCNVPGSAGARKWYRVAAVLPSAMDYVQIELWDGRGAFAAGAVAPGTYPLTGAELDPATCGICVRALGDKGVTGAQKEYFATAGQVVVTTIGGAGTNASVTLTGATFREIDSATKATVAGSCTPSLARTQLTGTIVAVAGGGGGGACPATIGD